VDLIYRTLIGIGIKNFYTKERTVVTSESDWMEYRIRANATSSSSLLLFYWIGVGWELRV
jgi:hypothetical protein